MLPRMIAFCLLSASCALAQSQPPAPGPRVLSQEQQQQREAESPNPEPNQPVPPPPVAPSASVSPPPSDAPSGNTEAKQDQPSPKDQEWWYATLPDWLMLAVTVALAFLAYWQYQTSTRTNELTTAIERSYVSIGELKLASENFSNGVSVRVPVINKGRTPAHFNRVNIKAGWFTKGTPPNPIDTSENLEPDAFVGSESETAYVVDFDHLRLNPELAKSVEAEVIELWVFVHIEYRDSVSTHPRETGVAGRWSARSKTFVVGSDRTHNYMRDKKT